MQNVLARWLRHRRILAIESARGVGEARLWLLGCELFQRGDLPTRPPYRSIAANHPQASRAFFHIAEPLLRPARLWRPTQRLVRAWSLANRYSELQARSSVVVVCNRREKAGRRLLEKRKSERVYVS